MPVSPRPPFVPAYGMVPPLRMLNLFPAPHPSYRNQQASSPYEGYACFSPPTLRTCPRDVPHTTNGKLDSRAPPFVSRPGCSFPLRRVRLFLPPTLRTCPGIAPPAANGKLDSPAHHSYRDRQDPSPYEGYACFSSPTLRTCPGIVPPAANAKLVSRAPPFVSRPASFSIPRQKRHWQKTASAASNI